MASDRANVADIRQPRKQLCPRRQIEQMSFPRSVLQTSPPDDRITTKICTTCTYCREILSLRTLRSGRTIEYCVLMNLRTIEKGKDWIWIGFQFPISQAMVHCDGKWELHEERRVRYNSVLPSSMYSNPAFQSPFFFLINCACTISHVPWIVRNPSTREGRVGLLYLTLRSSCNSHFPSQCTIACEMGNCISELRARYNSVCSKRWPNSFMFTKTWPQPSPQLTSRSLNGGDTLSHTSKEQDLFKGRVS